MPVNLYECMFLLDTTKMAGDLESARAKLHGTLERYGAEILASRPWDERKLAYPINGQKKGLYYLVYYKAEAAKIREIESDLKLNESLLRYMTTKVEPKLADALLAVARDERAFALQTMHEEGMGDGTAPAGAPPGAPTEGGEEGGPPGGRRPRRAPVGVGEEGKD
jgi:small subunit ribosomal protein S6